MLKRFSRRKLLKDSAIVTGAVVGTQLFGVPAILAQRSPNSKLGTAIIGANGRGLAHLEAAMSEQLVALVDIDDNRMAGAMGEVEKRRGGKGPKVKSYYDFRKMFDELAGQIDVVFVATPDHTHACATMAALKHGKHVYCEKPLTHDIYEARAVGLEARKQKVMTQMGNQGHAGDGIRVLREYLEAGAIGTVTEVHSWQDQRYGTRVRLPNVPVPAGIHWDEWLGPTPKVPYRPDVCPSVGGQDDDTGVGKGWYQLKPYGTGLLLCVGAHVCDPPHWALQLKYPTSCVCLEQEGEDEDSWGSIHRLLFEFPRPNQPTVKFYWYDGYRRKAPNAKGPNAWTLIRPELADELQEKFGRKFEGGGTLFVGEKGIMHCDIFGGGPRIVPEEKHREFPVPAVKYARVDKKHSPFQIHSDFLRACKEGGAPPSSNFPEVSGPYIEALLVGDLAMRGGRQEGGMGRRQHEMHQHSRAEPVREARVPAWLDALSML